MVLMKTFFTILRFSPIFLGWTALDFRFLWENNTWIEKFECFLAFFPHLDFMLAQNLVRLRYASWNGDCASSSLRFFLPFSVEFVTPVFCSAHCSEKVTSGPRSLMTLYMPRISSALRPLVAKLTFRPPLEEWRCRDWYPGSNDSSTTVLLGLDFSLSYSV